mgnify:CR=1 FL=1
MPGDPMNALRTLDEKLFEQMGASRKLAFEEGAISKEEIMESLRVTHFISGAGSIYTASRALEGIL